MVTRTWGVSRSKGSGAHLIMLLKHPLHKLVASVVELCAAARGYMQPVGTPEAV